MNDNNDLTTSQAELLDILISNKLYFVTNASADQESPSSITAIWDLAGEHRLANQPTHDSLKVLMEKGHIQLDSKSTEINCTELGDEAYEVQRVLPYNRFD